MAGAVLGAAFGAGQLWLLLTGVRSLGSEKLKIWAFLCQFLCPLAGLLLCAWLVRPQLVPCAVAMGAVLLAGSVYWALKLRKSDKQPGDDPEKKG